MAILTISREYGSGGREIGRTAANLLGYDYVDKETMLGDIRAEGEKWGVWAEGLDERCPTVWEKYDWSFRGFTALLQRVILDHAVKDKVVIIGRGGNFLLQGIPHAYRVRIQAPREERIRRIMRRANADHDAAQWLAEKINGERECFLRTVYGKQWDDPAEYDRIFDTGAQPQEDIAGIIKNELSARERFNTEEARDMLKMRALAAAVKAGIATNPDFFIPILDVSATGDELTVRGVTHDPAEHKRIEEAAKRLARGHPVRCELHYRK